MMKKMLFALTLASVLCAGAASAVQLRTAPHAVKSCGTTCTSNLNCSRPCFCFKFESNTTGFCQPEGPSLARK